MNQRMTQSIKPLTMAAIFVAGTVIAAYGHGGATGIVKERMDGMMAMGKALSVVADMFKGKTGFDGVKIGDAAKIVRAHAAEIDGLFPDTEASRKGKGTEALPAVWDKRSDFTAIAVELEKTRCRTGSHFGQRRSKRYPCGVCRNGENLFRLPRRLSEEKTITALDLEPSEVNTNAD